MKYGYIVKKGLVCLTITAAMLSAAGCGGTKEVSTQETKQEAAAVSDAKQEADAVSDAEKTQESAEAAKKDEKEDSAPAEAAAAPAETTPAAAAADDSAVVKDGMKIDYKSSETYTKEDMDAAIDTIMKEFSTWEGCEMHTIEFTDDQTCEENVSYVNELDPDKEYTQCIVFVSSFHSPKEGGGAWEPDYEYEGWKWYLGRTQGSEWNLLTWGY